MSRRRVASYVLAVVLIVLLLPLALVVALAVLTVDGRPLLFRSPRIGRDGRVFLMLKFRTMHQRPARLRGHLITTGDDARVTRLGRWLRRYRLDELPQLINVLRNDIVLVGPRPESPQFAAHYTTQRADMLSVWPGIVDPGTLAFLFRETALISRAADPSAEYLVSVMPHRNRISIAYARTATVGSDLCVLLLTVLALVSQSLARRIEAKYLKGRA